MTTGPAFYGPLLGPSLHGIPLIGSYRLGFHAARRSTDRRGAVLAVLDAFRGIEVEAAE